MRTIKEKVTWVDILKPNDADIAALKKQHKFHPVILDELLHPSPRIRVERFDHYLFIVYHFPEYDPELKTSRRTELDILITKDKIITVHYEQLTELNSLFDQLSQNETERKKILGHDSMLLTYQIFERAIAFSLRQLRHIEERVSFVTQEIFNNKEEDLLKKISYIKRDILDYRLITHPQEKFFQNLHDLGIKFWGGEAKVYLSDLINDNLPVHRNLENYFQVIESLETTNTQLLNVETNQVIKKFTVGAFVFSFIFLFVFLQSIPHISDFVLASPMRFWIIFALVLALVGVLGYIFKKKKLW